MGANLKRKLQNARAPGGKRGEFIHMRVSAKQKKQIQKNATEAGCSISSYLLGLHELFNKEIS